MAKEKIPFTFSEFAKFDNGIIHAVGNREIESALKDCDDRPGDKKARVVNLQLTFQPISADGSHCDAVAFSFDFNTKFPKQKSRGYQLDLLTQRDGSGKERTAASFTPRPTEPDMFETPAESGDGNEPEE